MGKIQADTLFQPGPKRILMKLVANRWRLLKTHPWRAEIGSTSSGPQRHSRPHHHIQDMREARPAPRRPPAHDQLPWCPVAHLPWVPPQSPLPGCILGAGHSPGPLPRGTLIEPTTPGPGMRHPLCRCLYFPKQEEGSNPDPVEKPVSSEAGRPWSFPQNRQRELTLTVVTRDS